MSSFLDDCRREAREHEAALREEMARDLFPELFEERGQVHVGSPIPPAERAAYESLAEAVAGPRRRPSPYGDYAEDESIYPEIPVEVDPRVPAGTIWLKLPDGRLQQIYPTPESPVYLTLDPSGNPSS